MKYLDLSGFTFSGKHAAIELMREIDGYYVPHHESEFCLIRVQDGILDLESALVDNWSPIRSDAAIRRFKHLVHTLARQPKIWRPSDWGKTGWHYEKIFPGFLNHSKAYWDELIQLSWQAEWPFTQMDMGEAEIFKRRLKQRLGFKNAFSVELVLATGENFIDATKRYLDRVLSSAADPTTKTVVMHNAIEPFYPQRALRYFDDAKCIIVERDPRDCYVQGYLHSEWFRQITAAFSPAAYATRYRAWRKQIREGTDSKNVLRIQFENLVTNYQTAVPKILNFLGEDPAKHVRRRQFFEPNRSVENIGIWKKFKNQSDIRLISDELAEYCNPICD